MRFILKVLSGPHVGAELLLEDGDYIIGSDEGSDFIFSDLALLPRHFQLKALQDHLLIHPLDGEVHLDGKVVGAAETPLLPGQVVTAGTLHFGVAEADKNLPLFSMPSSSAAAQVHDSHPSPKNHADLPLNHDKEQSDSLEARGQSIGRGGTKRLKVLLGPFLFLSLLGLVFTVYHQGGNLGSSSSTLGRMETIQRMLSGLQMDSLKIERHENGSIKIKGHLKDEEQKRLLVEGLKKNALNAMLEIWTNEQLMSSVQEVLKTQGLKVFPEEAGLGVLRLKGYVPGKERLSALVSLLNKDIPGIIYLENEVHTIHDLESALTAWVAEAGLSGKVHSRFSEGHFGVQGKLAGEDMEKWRKVSSLFKEKFGSYGELDDRAVVQITPFFQDAPQTPPTPSPEGMPVLKIRSAVIGKVKYVVTEEGKKLFEGAGIGGDYVIQSIEPDRIILRRGEQETAILLDAGR